MRPSLLSAIALAIAAPLSAQTAITLQPGQTAVITAAPAPPPPAPRVDTVYLPATPVPAPTPAPTPTPEPAPNPPGPFATADVVADASFETGWDGFVNWSGGTPSGVTRIADPSAPAGQYVVRRSWTPSGSDQGAQLARSWTAADRVWIRFTFRLTAPWTNTGKFARLYNRGFTTPLGGLFIGQGANIIHFGDDVEQPVTSAIGLTQDRVIDGRWHTIEMEYCRNNCVDANNPQGYPSAAFWFDGQPAAGAEGTADVWYGASHCSSGCSKAFWKGGRLYVGSRSSTGKLDTIELLATINGGNTTTGSLSIDRVAISTVGRIGP